MSSPQVASVAPSAVRFPEYLSGISLVDLATAEEAQADTALDASLPAEDWHIRPVGSAAARAQQHALQATVAALLQHLHAPAPTSSDDLQLIAQLHRCIFAVHRRSR